MSGKYALIIGNTEYIDPGLAQLSAPGKDAEDFARVLEDHEIGAFDDVSILLNQPEPVVRRAIDEFFDEKKPDDLLVLYFSGHGVRDELGALYLAVKNTIRSRLRSTAVKSEYIREAMDQSRSRRQVLILDCCNSGAFEQGIKAATGVSIGTASAFEGGFGRVILTASDSTQFAWEGDKVIGETDNSLFTHFLVEGLEGKADQDGDGRITVDELYDYAYEKVRLATPKQTPSKFSSKEQGEIILRQSTRIENIKPLPLSAELIDEIEDTRPYVREAAVQKLEKIIKGRNIGLASSAKEVLERIAAEDDSRRVSQTATQVLESIRQVEQEAEEERKVREEAERIAMLTAEEERKAKEEAKRLALAKAEQEAAGREAARLKAEREAAELAAREATKKAAQEKAEREAAEKDIPAPGKHAGVRQSLQRQVILKWAIVGIIGLCVLGVGAWGVSAYLASLGPLAPTKKPATEILGTTVPSATEAHPAIEAPTAYECTDALGCITIGPTDPVHIAYWGVLSGPDGTLGEDSKRGIEIAIDDMGGKFQGHDILLTTEDAGCKPEGGATAASKLAKDTSLVALVGASCSDETIGGIAAITAAGLTTISPSNTRPALTDPSRGADYAGYLRTSHSDAFQGKAVAEFAYNFLRVRKAATIYDGSSYAQDLQQAFADNFKQLGGTIVAQEAVGNNDTDMRLVLTTVAAAGPEFVYFPVFVAAGGYITSQIRDVAGLENVKIAGSDGIFTPDFIKAAGPNVKGMYLSSPDFSSFPGGYDAFVEKHNAKYGSAPLSIFHAHAYDATNIIFAALTKVAVVGVDGTIYVPRKALRDAIFATKNFKGITGTLSCSASGDCGAPVIAVYEIVNSDPSTWNPQDSNNPNPKKIYP